MAHLQTTSREDLSQKAWHHAPSAIPQLCAIKHVKHPQPHRIKAAQFSASLVPQLRQAHKGGVVGAVVAHHLRRWAIAMHLSFMHMLAFQACQDASETVIQATSCSSQPAMKWLTRMLPTQFAQLGLKLCTNGPVRLTERRR